MPKKLDWNKVRKMAEKGFSAKEISESMNIAKGTLYNNKEKWVPKNTAGMCVAEVVDGNDDRVPQNNISSAKEIIEVKEFYKRTLKSIRDKISYLISKELDEDSYYEVQLLEKLVRITKEARQLDYIAHDILTYKDLASLEIMVKKLELEVIRMKE